MEEEQDLNRHLVRDRVQGSHFFGVMQDYTDPYLVIYDDPNKAVYTFHYCEPTEEMVFYKETNGVETVQRWSVLQPSGDKALTHLLYIMQRGSSKIRQHVDDPDFDQNKYISAKDKFELKFNQGKTHDGKSIHKLFTRMYESGSEISSETPFILEPSHVGVSHCKYCEKFEKQFFEIRPIKDESLVQLPHSRSNLPTAQYSGLGPFSHPCGSTESHYMPSYFYRQ